MWSTQYYFLLSGNGLIAPLCVQVYADTSTALRCDSATDAPLSIFTTKVAVVTNLAPRKICGVESQGMILAAMDDKNNLSVMTVDKDIIAGSEIG